MLALLPDWASGAWNLLLVLLGFTAVIFFHELGHFIAAKWAKVRVERFAVGFGRELAGVTLGETRYSLNILPLGGFVKMLGQEDFAVDKSGELKVKADPDSFTSKSVGKRMVIVSAGVIMNLLFAAVAFATIMMLGHYTAPPVVGIVDPTSAASRAGIRPGDAIRAVNGKPIRDFQDLFNAVVLSDMNEELELTVERDGKLVEPKPRVLPEYKTEASVRQIGLSSAMTRRVAATISAALGSTDARELQPNDLLYQIGAGAKARPVKQLGDVWDALLEARGLPITLTVRRPNQPGTLDELTDPDANIPSTERTVEARAFWRLLPSEGDDLGTCSLLGLVPRLVVTLVSPRGPAALAGIRPGDVIVRVGTMSDPSYAELRQQIESHDDRDLRVVVRRTGEANGSLSAASVAFVVDHREDLIEIADADPLAAGRQLIKLANDSTLNTAERSIVSQVAVGRTRAAAWRKWLEDVDTRELVVRPTRPFKLLGPRGRATVQMDVAPGEDDSIVVADVLDALRGRPSPAGRADVPRGAALVRVDGKPVTRWTELAEVFRARAGETLPLEFRQGTRRFRALIAIPQSIATLVKLPADARLTRIAGQASTEIDASGRQRTASLPDWQAVEALLRRNMGKTIPVEYRTSDGAPHTSEMAVTPDNADPWLLRVVYAPSFMCYPLRQFVRDTNPITALIHGSQRAYTMTVQTYLTIKHLIFTREVGVENLKGPVGILRQGTQIAEGGLVGLILFLGVISANLAVINFLPLPIVDGGLFLFLILEKIRGEPVSLKIQVVTQLIGIALIVTMFLFVTFQDIANWNR